MGKICDRSISRTIRKSPCSVILTPGSPTSNAAAIDIFCFLGCFTVAPRDRIYGERLPTALASYSSPEVNSTLIQFVLPTENGFITLPVPQRRLYRRYPSTAVNLRNSRRATFRVCTGSEQGSR